MHALDWNGVEGLMDIGFHLFALLSWVNITGTVFCTSPMATLFNEAELAVEFREDHMLEPHTWASALQGDSGH
jgi:hypothetical protein